MAQPDQGRQAAGRDICSDEPLPTAAALESLGPPASARHFRLSEPITEFRVKLLNHFRLPRDGATVVREQNWSKGECRLTIWSVMRNGDWQPVEQLYWSAGDTF